MQKTCHYSDELDSVPKLWCKIEVDVLISNILGQETVPKSAVLPPHIAIIITWLNDIKHLPKMQKMLFKGPEILNVFCAFGANSEPPWVRHLDAHCTIATSEPTLNILKNFVRKLFQAIRKFFYCTSSLIRGSVRLWWKYCSYWSECFLWIFYSPVAGIWRPILT